MDRIEVTVDGRPVSVPVGASALDAVLAAGIELPHLCKDPDRPRLGTCRTCLVAIEGMRGPQASCATPATAGMAIRTVDPDVVRVRTGVLQLTVDMLPIAPPELERTRELAEAAGTHGVRPGRFAPEPMPDRREWIDASNPFWTLDHRRCIVCQRCVDACGRVQHIGAIAMLGRDLTARIGTFRDAPVADSICTSCGQCWATCPTGAIRLRAPVSGGARAMPCALAVEATELPTARGDELPEIVQRVETVCPYCGVGCGIALDLSADGQIVQVEDVPEHPSSQGMLCVKGRFGLGFVHAPDRLTEPLIRERKGGELRPATWDEALDLVADRLVAHRGRLGVLGSAKATNEDNYVLQKLARGLLGTNSVDHCARLCHSPSMAGLMEMLGSGSTSNSYTDFERAGCLMVVGSDTDANHPVIAARVRRAVLENDTKLVVVNPRRTRLCSLADVWLRPRPGTDVALFNGLARVALDEGLWDPAFVAARTEGFEEWRASLAGYDAETAAGIAGVEVEDLRRAARLFARPADGRGSCLLWGMGITQHTSGIANVQAMVNLALATGQVGKPGTGLSPLRGQNNVQGCCDVGVLPDHLPGYQGTGPEARAKFAAAWGLPLPEAPGLKLTEMVDAAADGEMRAMYVTGENPLLTEANLNHAREAFARLEFLCVQTIAPNESTELADVVLPAACFAEKDGTFTNSERRVQLVRKALEPPGEARADWAIACDLGRRIAARLGLPDDGFRYESPAEIWDELAALWPAVGGISHARLETTHGVQWPCRTADDPGTPLLFTEAFPRGRAKFVPRAQAAQAAELPDADYPLVLNTGRVLYHWHGGDLTRRVPGLVASYPAVLVAINPADASAAGVAEGALVRVSSRRGETVATAHVTDDVRPGEVFIPFVQLRGAAANLLTNNAYDPRAKIPEYKLCAVRIAPA